MFSVLFFLMLFTLSLGTIQNLTGAIITVLTDQCQAASKFGTALAVCIASFLVSLCYTTPVSWFISFLLFLSFSLFYAASISFLVIFFLLLRSSISTFIILTCLCCFSSYLFLSFTLAGYIPVKSGSWCTIITYYLNQATSIDTITVQTQEIWI